MKLLHLLNTLLAFTAMLVILAYAFMAGAYLFFRRGEQEGAGATMATYVFFAIALMLSAFVGYKTYQFARTRNLKVNWLLLCGFILVLLFAFGVVRLTYFVTGAGS